MEQNNNNYNIQSFFVKWEFSLTLKDCKFEKGRFNTIAKADFVWYYISVFFFCVFYGGSYGKKGKNAVFRMA